MMASLSGSYCLSIIFSIIFVFIGHALSFSETEDNEQVLTLVKRGDYASLKQMGPGVMHILAYYYSNSENEAERLSIAHAFYNLGWKSDAAMRALMRDVHTDQRGLRISVQYALGRVSANDDVVDVLLANMQEDNNPLFRDKAACALAYDQIHLSEEQKVRVYEGLIDALNDPKLQVRKIALQALNIHTGQTKGFVPKAPLKHRAKKIEKWELWLEEYKSNL